MNTIKRTIRFDRKMIAKLNNGIPGINLPETVSVTFDPETTDSRFWSGVPSDILNSNIAKRYPDILMMYRHVLMTSIRQFSENKPGIPCDQLVSVEFPDNDPDPRIILYWPDPQFVVEELLGRMMYYAVCCVLHKMRLIRKHSAIYDHLDPEQICFGMPSEFTPETMPEFASDVPTDWIPGAGTSSPKEHDEHMGHLTDYLELSTPEAIFGEDNVQKLRETILRMIEEKPAVITDLMTGKLNSIRMREAYGDSSLTEIRSGVWASVGEYMLRRYGADQEGLILPAGDVLKAKMGYKSSGAYREIAKYANAHNLWKTHTPMEIMEMRSQLDNSIM